MVLSFYRPKLRIHSCTYIRPDPIMWTQVHLSWSVTYIVQDASIHIYPYMDASCTIYLGCVTNLVSEPHIFILTTLRSNNKTLGKIVSDLERTMRSVWGPGLCRHEIHTNDTNQQEHCGTWKKQKQHQLHWLVMYLHMQFTNANFEAGLHKPRAHAASLQTETGHRSSDI